MISCIPLPVAQKAYLFKELDVETLIIIMINSTYYEEPENVDLVSGTRYHKSNKEPKEVGPFGYR